MACKRCLLVIACVAIALISVSRSDAGQGRAVRTVCDPDEAPLFICETNLKDKYLAICALEEEVGKRWSTVQYRFGPEDRAELVLSPHRKHFCAPLRVDPTRTG